MSICIIDTSIYCNILRIPGKCQNYEDVMQTMKKKVKTEESLMLPMATIIETGNHIAQNGDGGQRRSCAEKFIKQLKQAIEGDAPWTPINFLEIKKLSLWLKEFPDYAMSEVGFGDLSIIKDFEELTRIHSGQRVYIWAIDDDLAGYDYRP